MTVIRLHDRVSASDPRQRSPHLTGLDRVRAGAALGVVLLHACVPYLRHPMPGLLWAVGDSASDVADLLFWAVEVFIMPVFLILAGFLFWRSSQRHSAGELVRSRARRLLIPLVFGLLVILPIDLYVWTLGLVSEGVVPAVKLKSFKFDPPISESIWGTAHLWFLGYVFLYVTIVAVGMSIRKRWSGFGTWLQRVSVPKVALSVLALTAISSAWLEPEVVWGFQHGFLPIPTKWLYCGAYFGLGWFVGKWDSDLAWSRTQSSRFAALGAVLVTCSVILGRWHLEHGGGVFATGLLATITTSSATLMSLGLIGWATRNPAPVSRLVKYVAAASFWIYLVHHPVVGLLHLELKWWLPWASPLVKLMLSFCGTTALCVLSYEVLIVRTPLGIWLGFRTARVAEPERVEEPSASRETRRAA